MYESKENNNILFIRLVTHNRWHVEGKENESEGPKTLVLVPHIVTCSPSEDGDGGKPPHASVSYFVK